jgi:putative membrane protein
MVVPSQKSSWLNLLFSYYGTIAVKIWTRLLAVLLSSCLVTALYEQGFLHGIPLKISHFSLITLALSIFLGFRNNTSYDRFWEGRKLWGGVVNMSRNFCRQLYSFLGHPEGQELQKTLARAGAAYPHLLRMHLRDEWNKKKLEHLLPSDLLEDLEKEQNKPVALLHWMGLQLKMAQEAGWLHVYHQPTLEETLSNLCNLQGGCERIRTTPIPYSYNVLLHRIVALYCFSLSFGLVSELTLGTPIVVGIISYAFLGLDAIGDEIENPFERDQNDLPLDALAHMIESNIRQRMGEEPLKLHQPDPKTRLLL